MTEERRAAKLALESHILFIVGLCGAGKMFQIQCNSYTYIIITIVTLLTLDSVVSLSLIMR